MSILTEICNLIYSEVVEKFGHNYILSTRHQHETSASFITHFDFSTKRKKLTEVFRFFCGSTYYRKLSNFQSAERHSVENLPPEESLYLSISLQGKRSRKLLSPQITNIWQRNSVTNRGVFQPIFCLKKVRKETCNVYSLQHIMSLLSMKLTPGKF